MAIKQVGTKTASIISRKTAKAIVMEGSQGIMVNTRSLQDYFKQERFINPILKVLEFANISLNLNIKVFGGGISAQSDAIKCALARYITAVFPEQANEVRSFIKIDNRVVERKKYGLYKSRKAYVFRRR